MQFSHLSLVSFCRIKNCSHAFRSILAESGVKGLWRGWVPNVQRAALVNMGGNSGYFLLFHQVWLSLFKVHVINYVSVAYPTLVWDCLHSSVSRGCWKFQSKVFMFKLQLRGVCYVWQKKYASLSLVPVEKKAIYL